jgi:hypothetical protein
MPLRFTDEDAVPALGQLIVERGRIVRRPEELDARLEVRPMVKEFDAILKPYAPEVHGANFKPSVKFLGTPHDAARPGSGRA